MVRSIEEIVTELAEVLDALVAAPDDDFVLRYELLSRRGSLRDEADRLRVEFDEQQSTPDILVELQEAHKRRDAEINRMSGRTMMSGPGGTGAAIGAVSGEMVKLSLKANEARASESLTSRIATLETLLEKRGVDADAGSDQAT